MSDSEFPYRRIVAELRASILDGRLASGDRLGSEWELAEAFATSRPTVRRAVAVLKAEGLVVSGQGKGTFVRPRPPAQLVITAANFRKHRDARQPGFNAQITEQGRRPRQRLLSVSEAGAPSDVAGLLGLETDAAVVARKRLFLVDDEPVATCDSYYPADLVRGTALAKSCLIRGGAITVIEDAEGPIQRTLARSVDELTSRMPKPAEVDQLRLTPGTPVMRIVRTMYDVDNAPVEVQVTVAAADRHSFRYEVDL